MKVTIVETKTVAQEFFPIHIVPTTLVHFNQVTLDLSKSQMDQIEACAGVQTTC